MTTRPRGRSVLVTARVIADNPAFVDWLTKWFGHHVTVVGAGKPIHNPQFCLTCGGSPSFP